MPAAIVLDAHDSAEHRRVATGHIATIGGAAMMATLIFLISLVTLFMFFVSYCRSMMASAARHELSEEVRDVTGIKETASARDYERVIQIFQLCPERPEDRSSLRPVSLYHSCLKTVQGALATVMPGLKSWMEQER